MTIKSPSTYISRYKNQPSYVIQSALLRAEFLTHGARMVSLASLLHPFEFLCQQSGSAYSVSEYGAPLAAHQSAGFDDMFPTIEECFDEDPPWKDVPLPDHGEAFSLQWHVEVTPDALSFSYHGVRLPYCFHRTVSFQDASTLRLDYNVENLSPFPLSYVWSAHPMLVAPAGTRIVFPQECRRAITVLSESGRLGTSGDEILWPLHSDSNGTRHNLDTARSSTVRDREKYFFTERLRQGWCAAHYPEAGLSLTLGFPVSAVPYAAVVLNEGWSNPDRPFLLLEPCTTPLDRPDFSGNYTADSRLGPKEQVTWFLTFSVDTLGEAMTSSVQK